MATRVVERRIVTVLFADLVGFTSLSERLDAEDIALVQDAYFDAVRATIERHGGQLEKFVGDAAMAVFGVPRVRDDDAERAVRAGLALVGAVTRVGASLGLEDEVLRVRVGVNSGEVVYGEASSDRGPVTGDTVNVAARLQAAAEPGSVVVGELTALAVADGVELERLGGLDLKGKADSVQAARVVSVFPERSRERALAGLQAPTIGRQRDLARVCSGSGRLVVVAPPGVGKTRLLEEHARAAEEDGAKILRARLRPDLLSPFEPVGQLVRSVGMPDDVLGLLPNGRAQVVRDALAAVIAPVEATAGVEDRDALYAAWLDGLDALARDGRPVWHVEDLHWASPDLLTFLEVAGRERYVVGTARPVLLEAAAEWCDGAEILHLEPLPQSETAELVRALIGDVLPDELLERIAERSGGNALFVEELLRSWVSSGALLQDDAGWKLALDAHDVSLPPTVQAIYTGQLDDLPPPARVAARRASVAGRRFPFRVLELFDVPDAREAVGVLARRALIADTPDDPVLGESYVYRHALLRDTGYATLARSERSTLHVVVADWLAQLPVEARATLAEVIARHYAAGLEQAPELAPAVCGRSREEIRAAAAEWFEQAAEVAASFAAWESARSLGLRSLELTADESSVLRGRRLERLAEPTANTAGVDEAMVLLGEAVDAYRAGRSDDDDAARRGLASAGAALTDFLYAQTWFSKAKTLVDDLLDEIGPPDDVARARLYIARALAVVGGWDDYDRSALDAKRALEIARKAGDPRLELAGLDVLARIAGERGDDAAEGLYADVERVAREVGDWPRVAGALRIRAGLQSEGDAALALELFDRAQELADAHGLVEARGWCDYGRAEIQAERGEWDEATAAALRAIDLAEAHGFERVAIRSWFVLLPLARARADGDLVRRSYPLFERLAQRPYESPYQRIIVTAAHLHFAAFGLEEDFVPEVEPRLPSFELTHDGASWVAAVEAVVAKWLDARKLTEVGDALDRMRASIDRHYSILADGTELILRARLQLARDDAGGAADAAGRALAVLGPDRPWWRGKAIRVLAAARVADHELIEEAEQLEGRLGVSLDD